MEKQQSGINDIYGSWNVPPGPARPDPPPYGDPEDPWVIAETARRVGRDIQADIDHTRGLAEWYKRMGDRIEADRLRAMLAGY